MPQARCQVGRAVLCYHGGRPHDDALGETAVNIPILIEQYLAGPQLLRRAIDGMTAEQFDARPIAGQWSTREVVCHIADYEPIYADRMKRVIAENEPTILGGDPAAFTARLAYGSRDVEEESALILLVRRQMARILRALRAEDFQRRGIHVQRGPMTLENILDRVTSHIPHHAEAIMQKRMAMGSGPPQPGRASAAESL